MSMLYHTLPTWLLGVLIIGAFVVVAVAGLLGFRWAARGRLFLSEEMNNDIIFFASAIGVFYSLMAGLMAVAVWGNYSAVQDLVSQEAASIAALYRDVTSLPEPARGTLQERLREYNAFIIEQTWPAQRRGLVLDEATRKVNAFAEGLFAFEPATLGEQARYAETLRQFNHMIELRRKRIGAIGGALPTVMWGVMLIGALLSVTVTYLLQVRTGVQAMLTAFLATFIGLVVFVMAGLDSPLTGPLAIKPTAYQIVQDRLINLK
jgi:hypothetical protein